MTRSAYPPTFAIARHAGAMLTLGLLLLGCAHDTSGHGSHSHDEAAHAGAGALRRLPDGVPPAAPELAPLGFLEGSWVAVNPNKTVNREQWTAPRGKVMTGAFHQLRRDASPAFYELSTIVVEAEGVRLYHRHMHRQLEVDERRKDTDVFRLLRAEENAATFEPMEGTSAAGEQGIATMTYRLDVQGRLLQELKFKPGSKEKDFSSVYVRE